MGSPAVAELPVAGRFIAATSAGLRPPSSAPTSPPSGRSAARSSPTTRTVRESTSDELVEIFHAFDATVTYHTPDGRVELVEAYDPPLTHSLAVVRCNQDPLVSDDRLDFREVQPDLPAAMLRAVGKSAAARRQQRPECLHHARMDTHPSPTEAVPPGTGCFAGCRDRQLRAVPAGPRDPIRVRPLDARSSASRIA
jgi:hypothetical protein